MSRRTRAVSSSAWRSSTGRSSRLSSIRWLNIVVVFNSVFSLHKTVVTKTVVGPSTFRRRRSLHADARRRKLAARVFVGGQSDARGRAAPVVGGDRDATAVRRDDAVADGEAESCADRLR